MNATNLSNGTVTVNADLQSAFIGLVRKYMTYSQKDMEACIPSLLDTLAYRARMGWNTSKDLLVTAELVVAELYLSTVNSTTASHIIGAGNQLVNALKAYNTPEGRSLMVAMELLNSVALLDGGYAYGEYAIKSWVTMAYDRMGFMQF